MEGNKKLRIEAKTAAPPLFPPDLTVEQLREALSQRGIEHAHKGRAELVALLQLELSKETVRARDARIAALSTSLAASSLAAATPRSPRFPGRSGFHRLPADCVRMITEFLELNEIAGLAISCKLLDSLASLKLKGPPSLALQWRTALDDCVLADKLTVDELSALFHRFSRLETINLVSHLSADAYEHLISSCATTLRELTIKQRETASPQLLQLIFRKCSRLQYLQFEFGGCSHAQWTCFLELSQLRSLQTLDVWLAYPGTNPPAVNFGALLDAAPNLLNLYVEGAECLTESDFSRTSQLQELDARCHDAIRPLRLQQFPALKSLVLQRWDCVLAPHESISLPKLQDLYLYDIYCGDDFNEPQWMQRVWFPALKHLSVSVVDPRLLLVVLHVSPNLEEIKFTISEEFINEAAFALEQLTTPWAIPKANEVVSTANSPTEDAPSADVGDRKEAAFQFVFLAPKLRKVTVKWDYWCKPSESDMRRYDEAAKQFAAGRSNVALHCKNRPGGAIEPDESDVDSDLEFELEDEDETRSDGSSENGARLPMAAALQ